MKYTVIAPIEWITRTFEIGDSFEVFIPALISHLETNRYIQDATLPMPETVTDQEVFDAGKWFVETASERVVVSDEPVAE